jgi:hypothetical protein
VFQEKEAQGDQEFGKLFRTSELRRTDLD